MVNFSLILKIRNQNQKNKMLHKLITDKKLIAGIVIIALLVFLIYAGIPFISAFFGAGILAFIFHPLDKKLRKYISPITSAIFILIISLILIIIPLIFIINGLVDQARLLPTQIEKISVIGKQIELIFPFLEIDEKRLVSQIGSFFTKSIGPIISNIIHAIIILFLLFFLFFYLLIYYEKIKEITIKNLPFSEKNNLIIIKKFKEVTYSTIVGTFLIAIIQGFLLGFNFYLFKIPNAIFWGFVTAILSILPVVGPPLIWIPAAIFLFASDEIAKGIAMLIIGILISTVDNIIRPMINQRYGSVHPIVSIVGIYIGISQFGIIGLFIGPLLLSYFIMFWHLYREEYS